MRRIYTDEEELVTEKSYWKIEAEYEKLRRISRLKKL